MCMHGSVSGKVIEWKHLRDLYHKFHSMAMQSAGLSLLPKLKMEHVVLTSFSWMRIAQVSITKTCSDGHQLDIPCTHTSIYGYILIHAHIMFTGLPSKILELLVHHIASNLPVTQHGQTCSRLSFSLSLVTCSCKHCLNFCVQSSTFKFMLDRILGLYIRI